MATATKVRPGTALEKIKSVTINELKEADKMIAAFNRLEAWVEGLRDDELLKARQMTVEAQALLKVRQGMGDFVTRAKVCEAKILRKLGLSMVELDVGDRRAANFLSSLSDDEFQRFCEGFHESIKLGTEINKYIEQTHYKKRQEKREAWIRAGDANYTRLEDRAQSLRHHARHIIKQLIIDERAISLGDVVLDLAEELNLDLNDEAIKTGLHEVARYVTKSANNGTLMIRGAAGEGVCPTVVTFEDGQSFVRVPWSIASMLQLRYMVKLRRKQADELEEVAQNLENVYSLLEPLGDSHFDKCAELVSRGIQSGNLSASEATEEAAANA